MNAFLASTRNIDEARTAYEAGADWIDLKEPAAGALGAVSRATVEHVVAWSRGLDQAPPLSATIGDCWTTPPVMPGRCADLKASGVGYAKIGLFAASPSDALSDAVSRCCEQGPAIILVCFAERPPLPSDIAHWAGLGVKGLMLDTAQKTGPSLSGLLGDSELREFVLATKRYDLLCGLAGRLQLSDVDGLVAFGADYLGFRSALCSGNRDGQLSASATRSVAAQIRNATNRAAQAAAALET